MEVDEELRVRFVTKQASLAVPDTALSLATTCQREQLGDVVNKLRGGTALDLAFLWDDKLVQGSLAQHAARHGLSTENVAELEYFKRSPEPEHVGSTTCGDDWVGALASNGGSVLAGSYDGRVFWARDGTVAAAAHAVAPAHAGFLLNYGTSCPSHVPFCLWHRLELPALQEAFKRGNGKVAVDEGCRRDRSRRPHLSRRHHCP